MTQDNVIGWLMEGDPAVRWQVMRDLLDRPEDEWQAERARVQTDGWGQRLLAEQGPDGRWAGGIYTPKWTSTHYTLLLLRSLGLPSDGEAGRSGMKVRLDRGFASDGGIGEGRGLQISETCITGMGLACAAYFIPEDERVESLKDHLLRVQTPDGGWNCRWRRGSVHGSFHTTISALEGLHEYAMAWPEGAAAADAARARGHDFLFEHRMYRSHRTGEVSNQAFARLSFPPHWHYDILRGLDYLQAAAVPRDHRLADSVDLLMRHRREDGTWPLQNRYAGKYWFHMEPVGQPSRWNTLRALRVLRWWEAQS